MSTEFTTIKPEDVTLNTTFDTYETLNDMNSTVAKLGEQGLSFTEQSTKATDLQTSFNALMNAQLDALKAYKIPNDSKKLIIDKTYTVIKNKNATPPYTRIKQDEYVIDAKSKDDLESKYSTWRKGISDTYDFLSQTMDANVKKYNQNDASSQGAAIALQQLLADDVFTKLSNLERQIDYRRFYFPGGVPEQKQLKEGQIIKTGPGWDPRYLEEYIGDAKQYGFHRWMLAPIGTTSLSEFTPISYATMDQYLKSSVNWAKGYTIKQGYTAANIAEYVAPLVYFDKLQDYVDNYKGVFTDADAFKEWIDQYLGSEYDKVMDLLKVQLGHSADEFKTLDAGYYAPSESQAFDAAELTVEFEKYKSQYETYKKKLWDIISKSTVLQLCFNYADMTGDNINISQTLECNQSIGDNNNSTGTLINDIPGTDDGSGNGKPKDGGGGGNDDDTDWKTYLKEHKEIIIVIGILFVFVIVWVGVTMYLNHSRSKSIETMLNELTKKANSNSDSESNGNEIEMEDISNDNDRSKSSVKHVKTVKPKPIPKVTSQSVKQTLKTKVTENDDSSESDFELHYGGVIMLT